MMTIYGLILSTELVKIINLHRLVQFDGFITLIIMGIGYLIVPRFRNISVPSVKLAYASFVLILVSLILSMVVSSTSMSEEIHTIFLQMFSGF
jgi:hypothetical protein